MKFPPVTEEIKNSLLTSAYLREEQAAVSEQVAATGRAREQAHEAYLGGVSNLMDELELERQYLAAQDRLSQAEVGTARAMVATFRSSGGGW